MWLNHPQGCLGFRITSGGFVAVYATDNEPGDPVFDKAVRKLAQGADVLIYDAQYLPEEYEARKRGWGHSHWREGVSIATQSEVKHLVLFHHDPDHCDESIDEIVKQAQQHFPRVTAASEGLAFEL
jgi:ribonuclease BN (tRNA processing enzyme)